LDLTQWCVAQGLGRRDEPSRSGCATTKRDSSQILVREGGVEERNLPGHRSGAAISDNGSRQRVVTWVALTGDRGCICVYGPWCRTDGQRDRIGRTAQAIAILNEDGFIAMRSRAGDELEHRSPTAGER